VTETLAPGTTTATTPTSRHGRGADLGIGLGLTLVYLAVLLGSMDMGFTRDEGYYFKAGELYVGWVDELAAAFARGEPGKAFARPVIERHFAYNPEHPALPKLLFGLSWRLFGKQAPPDMPPGEAKALYRGGKQPRPILGLLAESTAFRLPGALSAALLVGLIYLFGARRFGRRVGLAAAAAFALMPRAFSDAHLAAFDMPMALMWFATAIAFHRSLGRGLGWALITALLFGLALSTKHNSWFIPFTAAGIALLLGGREAGWRRSAQGPGLALPPVPLSLVRRVTVGALLAWARGPRLGFDTLTRGGWYRGRHMNHEYYWAYFFGTLYTKPPFPWHFPMTMTLETVPLVTLVLAALGGGAFGRLYGAGGRGWRGGYGTLSLERRRDLVVLGVNLIVPIAAFCTTRTPIFGGTKHWLPAMPFLALFAGLGFELLARRVTAAFPRTPRLALGLGLALGLALYAPAAWEVAHAHPHCSSYYNALLGGLPGKADHDMQREFWGDSSRPVLPWLNANLRINAPVFFQDTNDDSVLIYKREGLLRRDVLPVPGWGLAEYTLFHHHKEFLDDEYSYRARYGDDKPVAGVYQDGVPLLEVYQNRTGWRER